VVSRVPGNVILQDIASDGRVLLSHGANRPVIYGLVPGPAKERDLTWLDYSVTADISPDGRTMLFSEQGYAGGPQYAVYIRGTDGSPAIRLGKGNGEALSPDGKWALAIDLARPSRLVLLPTGVGEARTLPRHDIEEFQAAWWRGNEQVMFAGSPPGHGARVYVLDLAGGTPRAVTPEGWLAIDNAVSPDGRYVFAVTDVEGKIFPVDGGEARPIPGMQPGEIPIAWGADGLSLLVRSNFGVLPARVDRLDLATGRRVLWKELAPPDLAGGRSIIGISITPDARYYVYTYTSRLSNLYLVEGLK
jgi:dipeptidyl aminopeptidase/acylaminoacyl peptidase